MPEAEGAIDGKRSGGYGGRPMKRVFSNAVATAALLAFALGAPSARAQELVDIEVVAAGMSLAGVEIYVFALGEAFLVGETDASGVVTAPPDLVGLEPGDRLEVQQLVCAGGRAVLLVPRDEDSEDECRRRRTEDPSCACGSLGEVRWGERVAIDLVSAEPPVADVEPEYDEPDWDDGEPGLTWVVGAGAGWSSWPNLDQACAGAPTARTCELEAEAPTFRGSVEARRPDFPISLMGAVGYTTGLTVDQTFDQSSNPLNPRRNVVEMDVLTFEGYGVGRFAASESVSAFVALGYVWAHDRVEATTTFGSSGTTGTDERTASGGRFGGRAGADWWPAGRSWGLRIEAGGMSGDEENIDAVWSAGAMILFALGGR